ncbi:MAG: hypothetical protein U0935_03775 [Pirellulales bacterium]
MSQTGSASCRQGHSPLHRLDRSSLLITAARGRWFALLVVLIPTACFGQAETAKSWVVDAAFQQAWDEALGLTWEGLPLRAATTKLARQMRVAIWLDRRLDPDQLVTLSVNNEPLSAVCQRLAARVNARACRVGSVVYLGPTFTAERLATVAAMRRQECEAAPAAQRPAFVRRQSMRWNELAEPRALVSLLAQEVGCEVVDLDKRVPHDLWPAADWPPLAWSDRLSLVLAGFELTFVCDSTARTITLLPIPEEAQYEKVVSVKGQPAQVAAEIRSKFPQVDVRIAGAQLALRGSWEDLEVVERIARGQKVQRTTVVSGPSEFTLRVQEQPAGAVLRHIARQLMLNLEIAPDAQETLEQRVSFQAERLLLPDLLATVLKGTGLQFELRDQQLRVFRAAERR